MISHSLNNIFKQKISISKFIIFITLFNMLIYHIPFYTYAVSHLNIGSLNGILTFSSTIISLFIVTISILFLLAIISPKLLKIFVVITTITNSIALYFIVTYNVILDKTMMSNLFNTRISEATSYYDLKIFIYLIFLGILPSYFIAKTKVKETRRLTIILHMITSIIAAIVFLYLNSTTWLWLDKHAKLLGGLSMPWSYTINSVRYKLKQIKKNKKQILLPSVKFTNKDKMLVILIIGESARKKNFSLYGYKRETNPKLKNLQVSILKNTTSKTTYTTASVNSMLSYDGSTSDTHEPLPSFLHREGVDVIWRTSNWGEPPIHVESYTTKKDLKESCKGTGCEYDEVLLTGLDKRITNSKKNKIFVVLHTAGSHGPTYYKKYPKKFEIFKPVCKSVNLKECTNQELINAYDNTILYTDHLISKTIELLKHVVDRPTLLIYISDHGESLGEYGLYLHGTPYSIAPKVQKEIPFILWRSQDFIHRKAFDKSAIKKFDRYGQENIFHTILGAFDSNSSIYNHKLNVLNSLDIQK